MAERTAGAHVALLRGINLGSRRLPMKDLAAIFETAGCVDVSEIYVHFPNGMGKSKLTNPWFDSRLGAVSTMRNWRTVKTLEEMARG